MYTNLSDGVSKNIENPANIRAYMFTLIVELRFTLSQI
jgi:hypothetical protein